MHSVFLNNFSIFHETVSHTCIPPDRMHKNDPLTEASQEKKQGMLGRLKTGLEE